jgi:uncharacterized NAD-dependent epimerase/dehydratase family protein
MLGADQAVVLLQHGGLDSLTGKTGLAMLRHRQGPIVAVIDPHHAGASLETVTGIRRAVPVVADLQEALAFGPEVAVVGLAPSGGRLPQPVRADALAALRAGLCLASGLHTRLGDDKELKAACQPGRWIWDLRREPEGLQVAQARAAALPQRRVLALGTDMAVGKMSACLALQAAAEARGLPSGFVGTGQAGILISGSGVALDAVRVDYAAGAVEAAVLRAADRLPSDGVVLVEGQGSLCHPGSSASLPLLRGSQPTGLLLVHRAGQRTIERLPRVPLPPLPALVQLSEALAAIGRPVDAGPSPRVRALALNTARLEAAAAQRAIAEAQEELQLICADPLRGGAQILLEALVEEG